ncbi:MAG: hypothetical protein ACR2QS_05915 [Woeseiaceae bacterium]
MKRFILELLGVISAAILSVIASLLVIVIGGLMVGYGLHKEWEWLTNSGIFIVIFGFVFLTRYWWGHD